MDPARFRAMERLWHHKGGLQHYFLMAVLVRWSNAQTLPYGAAECMPCLRAAALRLSEYAEHAVLLLVLRISRLGACTLCQQASVSGLASNGGARNERVYGSGTESFAARAPSTAGR